MNWLNPINLLLNQDEMNASFFIGAQKADFKFPPDFSFQSFLSQIKSNLSHVIEMIKSKKDVNTIKTLQHLILSIENEITSFKEKQKKGFEMLSLQESDLSSELAFLSKRFDNYSDFQVEEDDEGRINRFLSALSDFRKQKYQKEQQVQSQHPLSRKVNEISSQLDSFLDSHGSSVTGGWDQQCHNQFVRLRAMFVSDWTGESGVDPPAEFFKRAAAEIPGQDLRTVQQHELFWKEYLRLISEKKNAIQQWKEWKENDKKEKMKQMEFEKKIEQNKTLDEKEIEEELKQKEKLKKALKEWKVSLIVFLCPHSSLSRKTRNRRE